MKRHTDIHQVDSPIYDFDMVLSSLKHFNRSQLIEISKHSSLLLAQECGELAQSIPEEIWKEVFTITIKIFDSIDCPDNNWDTYLSDFVSFCRRAACVCRSWSTTVPEVARPYFRQNIKHSNWVLGLYSDSILKLHVNNSRLERIDGKAFSKLSNLTKLCLTEGAGISNDDLLCLSSLRHLKLDENTSINDFSGSLNYGVGWKTNLLSLSIAGNEVLSGYSLYQMINLTALEISYNENISDYCIMSLTNLKKLNIQGKERVLNASLFTNLVSLKAN